MRRQTTKHSARRSSAERGARRSSRMLATSERASNVVDTEQLSTERRDVNRCAGRIPERAPTSFDRPRASSSRARLQVRTVATSPRCFARRLRCRSGTYPRDVLRGVFHFEPPPVSQLSSSESRTPFVSVASMTRWATARGSPGARSWRRASTVSLAHDATPHATSCERNRERIPRC